MASAARSGSARSGGESAAGGAAEPSANLRIMPREMRLKSERILSLTGLPRGFILALKDVPMYSQLLGLGGFALLEAQLETLRAADPSRLRIVREHGAQLELEAGRQHAWIVVPAVLDLAGELVEHHGEARLRVRDVIDPTELQVASALAGRAGLELRALGDSAVPDAVELEARPRAVSGDVRQDDPVLASALMHGTAIDSTLWWRIYHLAKQALEPDNPVSRRHAGTVIVLDDGRILGRADGDDETDFSFIAAAAASEPRPAGDD